MAETVQTRPDATFRALVAVTVLGALGSLLMSIAHAGLEVPLISALGPGGNRAVPPAAAAFAVGALLYGITAYGIVSRRAWSWPVGVVVNGLTLVSAAMPFRGVGSVAGIAISAAGLALLLTPSVRATLVGRRS